MVAGRCLMDPSPIPRWDVPKLDNADNLFVFAAGREARIYAVPPHTDVEPLAFEDRAFQVERFPDESCHAFVFFVIGQPFGFEVADHLVRTRRTHVESVGDGTRSGWLVRGYLNQVNRS